MNRQPCGISAMAKKLKEPFLSIPVAAIDSPAFRDLSNSGARMLLIVCRQHNGSNNGLLQACHSYAEVRGIGSKATVRHAVKDLIDHGFLFRTRSHGNKHGGNIPAKYAVTFYPMAPKEKTRELFLNGYIADKWKTWVPEKKQGVKNCTARGSKTVLSPV